MSDTARAIDAWEALYRAQVHVLRRLRAEFPDDEISFAEYDLLFNLYRLPGRSARIRDLNRHLLLTQPSVSRMLDRLAARGLVSKSPDPGDGRGTLVRLTDDGADVFRRVGAQHGRAIVREMAPLGPAELDELTRIADKLRGVDRSDATAHARPVGG